MTIGVIGCNIDLPDSFPVDFKDNAGNMVHANAPFGMFDDCHHATKTPNFPKFVNDHCSHLIITMANALRLGEEEHSRHDSLMKLIDFIEKPIVVFGLGAQGDNEEDIARGLPQASIDMLKLIAENSDVIGVRGPFTERVVRECAGVNKAFVTGCPSLFSRIDLVKTLRAQAASKSGRPAYAGTYFDRPEEQSMLHRAISAETYLIEPVNKALYLFSEAMRSGTADEAHAPYFVRAAQQQGDLSDASVQAYFANNFKMFRDMNSWISFVEQNVRFTYGTRFHVNMASILAGRPALWITHDTRTREMAEYFQLPNQRVEAAKDLFPVDLEGLINFEEFFDNYELISCRFNEFLSLAGLPTLEFIT